MGKAGRAGVIGEDFGIKSDESCFFVGWLSVVLRDGFIFYFFEFRHGFLIIFFIRW
jgi:hypothetical protein